MEALMEASVREFLGLFAVEPIDFDRIEQLLSADAVYRPHPEVEPVVGSSLIRAELERQLQLYNECDFQILNLSASSNQVFTERSDYVTQNGLRIQIKVAAIFEFDAAGKINGWREYWDMPSVQKQLAISAEQMEQYMEQV